MLSLDSRKVAAHSLQSGPLGHSIFSLIALTGVFFKGFYGPTLQCACKSYVLFSASGLELSPAKDYRILKEGWFKGGGYKGAFGDLREA